MRGLLDKSRKCAGGKNERKFLRGERVPRADQTLQSGNRIQVRTNMMKTNETDVL